MGGCSEEKGGVCEWEGGEGGVVRFTNKRGTLCEGGRGLTDPRQKKKRRRSLRKNDPSRKTSSPSTR